jgi:MarR family transcriptional regulator, 2-MHQ and catechol-resistance regulon repressor
MIIMADEEEQSLKLFVVFSRAYGSVRKKIEEDIRNYDLNPTEFAVLELVYHKGEQPIQRIGEQVLIASSSITYVVDKLEKKNYLKRKTSPLDRRITYAELTGKGKELMDEIFPNHRTFIHSLMQGLSSEEKKDMLNLLKKLGWHAEKN